MTRPSKREIERLLEELSPGDGDGPAEIVIKRTVVGTEWSADGESEYADLEAGETVTETERLEIGGET